MTSDQTLAGIRRVLARQAHLAVDVADLRLDDDLFLAGMSSHASVNVMLGLEADFGVEFPDAMLTRRSFSTMRTIAEALTQLHAETPVT